MTDASPATLADRLDTGDGMRRRIDPVPPVLGRVLVKSDCSAIAAAANVVLCGSSGEFLTPSPPAEKTTSRQDQARQARTDVGNGHCGRIAQAQIGLMKRKWGAVVVTASDTTIRITTHANHRRL